MTERRDLYVLVKVRDDIPESMVGMLEHVVEDLTDNVLDGGFFEEAHVVRFNGFGDYVRPIWANEHVVKEVCDEPT